MSPRAVEYWVYGDHKLCIAVLSNALNLRGGYLSDPYSKDVLSKAKEMPYFRALFQPLKETSLTPRSDATTEYLYPVFTKSSDSLSSFVWLQHDPLRRRGVARSISIAALAY